MADSIRPILATKYKDLYEALDRAALLAERTAIAVTTKRSRTNLHKVTLTLFTRMYNTFESCRILLQEGYGLQAGMLTRSVLEDYINLHYITQNKTISPEDLATRYISYQYMIPAKHANILRELGEALSPDQEAYAQEARAAYRARYPKTAASPNDNDWSGKDLKSKAEEAGVKDAYLLLQQPLSALLHGGPTAWSRIVVHEPAAVSYLIGPHDNYISEPVPALCLFLTSSVETIGSVFGDEPLAREANSLMQEFHRKWTRGRNSPRGAG
jgi:hypothetical protein